MGNYAENLNENNRFGDLTDVYNYVSFDTSGSTPVEAARGTVANHGPYNASLIEVEILANQHPDERFPAGTKLYVDIDTVFGTDDLIPVKNSSGVGIGYSVRLSSEREASVEEELDMLKRRVAALESA